MVVAALPLAVVVAAWLLLGERPHRRVWIGFVLAVVGVVWLSAGSEATESAPNPIFGNFLEVLAMLCGALYVVCAKQLSSRCSPVLITTMVNFTISLLFFLCLLPLPAVKLPDSFPLLPTLAILYLGVGVTMLSFLLYNFAVRSVPVSRTGAFLNLVPVLTLFMGMVFLDERLTAGQWAASALVFGGVILSQWKTAQSEKSRLNQSNSFPFRKEVRNERKRAFAGASGPRRNEEQLEAPYLPYGADAVYMGGPELSLRTACEGFSGEELGLAVADAHTAGVRVYYCLNAMPYDAQLSAVEAALERLPEMGVDGLIAADPGVIWLAKKHCPSVPLHLSTQAHSVNGAAVAFWREAGVERINLARELGFKQIRALAEAFPGVDFEVFVHGAMCLALSGHCLLSAWVNNRPANQGRCTQPCRFEYRGLSLLVEEQKRSGEALWEIREGEAFSGF